MSAYIVEKNHIDYLVFVGHTWRDMRAYDGEQWHEYTKRELGQMLWDENIRSVEHRYPSEPVSELPGCLDDVPYVYDASRAFWHRLDPVQVLKAAACYEYQSCEHPGWKDSAAKWWLGRIRSTAINKLKGYDDAEWGAPEPYGKLATSR